MKKTRLVKPHLDIDALVGELTGAYSLRPEDISSAIGCTYLTARNWTEGKSTPLPVFREKLQKLLREMESGKCPTIGQRLAG